MNSKELQQKIEEECKPVRVRGLLRLRKETLSEFLIEFFKTWNSNKETVYVGNGHVQTEPGKRRSFGDVFLIAKYYFPKATIKQVVDILYNVLPKSVPNFRSSYCSTINKRVFYRGTPTQQVHVYDQGAEDEYGMTVVMWKKLL